MAFLMLSFVSRIYTSASSQYVFNCCISSDIGKIIEVFRNPNVSTAPCQYDRSTSTLHLPIAKQTQISNESLNGIIYNYYYSIAKWRVNTNGVAEVVQNHVAHPFINPPFPELMSADLGLSLRITVLIEQSVKVYNMYGLPFIGINFINVVTAAATEWNWSVSRSPTNCAVHCTINVLQGGVLLDVETHLISLVKVTSVWILGLLILASCS